METGDKEDTMETGDNVLAVSWDDFAILTDEDLTVSFSSHYGPTDLFNALMNKPEFSSSVDAYSKDSTEDVFLISRDLALKSLSIRTPTADLMQATHEVFASVLQGDSQLPAPLREQITRHALALAKTSPDVFGENFKLHELARRGEFSLPDSDEEGHEHEHFDILQWLVCFKLLGKAFDLEGWEPVFAKSIVQSPDPKSVVIRVSLGHQRTMDVTHEAKAAMDTALNYMAGRPPALYHCLQAVIAVTLILGKALLSYIMPQPNQLLEEFNWDKVVVGDSTTYPEAPTPSKSDFEVIKAVHKLSKAQKDNEARRNGVPRSGVPGYESYLQKWKICRDIHAIYRTMYPKDTIVTTHDRVLASLKYCNSVEKMMQAVEEDIKKFLAARKVARKKAQLALDEAARLADAKAAEEIAQQLGEEKARKEAEKQQVVQNQAAGPRRSSRVSTATKTSAVLGKKQSKEVQRKDAEIAEVEKRLEEAAAEALVIQTERERIVKERQKFEAKEAREKRLRKKTKRNDTSRLDLDLTPRKKAKTAPNWDPPKLLKPGVYLPPGEDWKESSTKKLHLLSALKNQLTVNGMLDKPMTLATVMEFLGADGEATTFQERVFLYLMCLLLAQTRYVHGPTVVIIHVVQSSLCI
jgi:hypothetical protein